MMADKLNPRYKMSLMKHYTYEMFESHHLCIDEIQITVCTLS